LRIGRHWSDFQATFFDLSKRRKEGPGFFDVHNDHPFAGNGNSSLRCLREIFTNGLCYQIDHPKNVSDKFIQQLEPLILTFLPMMPTPLLDIILEYIAHLPISIPEMRRLCHFFNVPVIPVTIQAFINCVQNWLSTFFDPGLSFADDQDMKYYALVLNDMGALPTWVVIEWGSPGGFYARSFSYQIIGYFSPRFTPGLLGIQRLDDVLAGAFFSYNITRRYSSPSHSAQFSTECYDSSGGFLALWLASVFTFWPECRPNQWENGWSEWLWIRPLCSLFALIPACFQKKCEILLAQIRTTSLGLFLYFIIEIICSCAWNPKIIL
jgi:hypothetical protein